MTDGKDLKLYNTLTRTKEPFVPIDPDNVRIYVCGPTVYDYAHIGNARPVIVFDVLFRLLRLRYGADKVTYVRNVTDVDDKINARALERYPDLPPNVAIRRLTEETDAQFQRDVRGLGCLDPTHQPRATEHVPQMRALIERLVAKDFAYVADGHVLFSPEAMNGANGPLPRYGALANRSLDEMIAGARVEVAPYKNGPTDFVLWKPSSDDEPGWESPCGILGKGRPGWHIECSAMSMAKLLEPFGGGLACDDPLANIFDIHGGGIDLVFPHHENEIAQSCCAFGAPRMANVFMHNGFLQVEGQKMSKSLGNFVTIDDLLNTETFGGRSWPGEVLRFAMLKTHYRQPIDWTVRGVEEAIREIGSLMPEGDSSPGPASPHPSVIEPLLDDLNTPGMVAALHGLRKAGASEALAASLLWLGIPPRKAESLSRGAGSGQVEARISARLAARAAKNFTEADRIRDELVAMGIEIMDGKDTATGEATTTWRVKR